MAVPGARYPQLPGARWQMPDVSRHMFITVETGAESGPERVREEAKTVFVTDRVLVEVHGHNHNKHTLLDRMNEVVC